MNIETDHNIEKTILSSLIYKKLESLIPVPN